MVLAVPEALKPLEVGVSVEPKADTRMLIPAAAYELLMELRVAASIKVHSWA